MVPRTDTFVNTIHILIPSFHGALLLHKVVSITITTQEQSKLCCFCFHVPDNKFELA